MNWNVKDVGYVCGSIYGGGHIVVNRKYGNYAIVFETRNRQLADVFLKRFNRFSKRKGKIHVKRRLSGNEMKTSFVVNVYSKADVDMLEALGVSGDKEDLPEICRNNKEFMKYFLRGIFDSKATVRERFVSGKRRVSLRVFSVKRALLGNVKELLGSLGIKSMVYISGNAYCLDIEGRRKIRSFMDVVGFDNVKKRERIQRVIGYKRSVGE